MRTDREIDRSLKRDIARAAMVTTTATVSTFARTATAPVEALAGGVGAFGGLGTAVAYGIVNPGFASTLIDISAFGGTGLLFALVARLIKALSRGERDGQDQVKLVDNVTRLDAQFDRLERLPAWASKEQRAAFLNETLKGFSKLNDGGSDTTEFPTLARGPERASLSAPERQALPDRMREDERQPERALDQDSSPKD